MTRFMYLFRHHAANERPSSPEEMQRQMKAWMDWIDRLKQESHLVATGDRLSATGKVVRGKSKSVTDGPYVEAKDTIGGYLVVEAADLDQATALAHGCPVLDAGGSVEVRPISSM